MKVFSKQQFGDRLPVSADELVQSLVRAQETDRGSYSIPADSGAKTGLAKLLANVLLPRPDVVVWITGWNVWQTAEHLDLFYGYRRSKGEGRALIEAPIHIFADEVDKPQFVSIVSLILYFVWDAKIFARDSGFLISISHDEFIDLYGPESELKAIKEAFSSIGLKSNVDGRLTV